MEYCILCAQPTDNKYFYLCQSCCLKSEQETNEFQEYDLKLRENYFRYENTIMAENNMHRLFMVNSEGRGEYDSYRYDIFINTVTGIPYIKSWHFSSYTFPPGSVDVFGPTPISFLSIAEWAMKKSKETYEKYKGISKENWIDYIIDEI